MLGTELTPPSEERVMTEDHRMKVTWEIPGSHGTSYMRLSRVAPYLNENPGMKITGLQMLQPGEEDGNG